MTYRFEAARIYRMPTHFGPAPGPRQKPGGLGGNSADSPQRLSLGASFLTDPVRLEGHLPEGFRLSGEPIVTVECHYLTGIEWLAGRGYAMIHVHWPVAFNGTRDTATGRLLAVVWENLADPIITGRDEIGHPKLYAEIADPRVWEDAHVCIAGWMGFRFLDLTVSALREPAGPTAAPASDGTLMVKYVPRTGVWGEAEINQVTLTPLEDPYVTIDRRQVGDATVRFHHAQWSDLPTMAHVVNALADLPVIEPRGGSVMHSHGGKSFLDQRVLI